MVADLCSRERRAWPGGRLRQDLGRRRRSIKNCAIAVEAGECWAKLRQISDPKNRVATLDHWKSKFFGERKRVSDGPDEFIPGIKLPSDLCLTETLLLVARDS